MNNEVDFRKMTEAERAQWNEDNIPVEVKCANRKCGEKAKTTKGFVRDMLTGVNGITEYFCGRCMHKRLMKELELAAKQQARAQQEQQARAQQEQQEQQEQEEAEVTAEAEESNDEQQI